MSVLLTIVFGLLGLGIVIFFHELGHFIMARLTGIPVLEFSIGMGPRLVSFARNGITYKIGMLPIGGYCKLKGEDSYKTAVLEKKEVVSFEKDDFLGAHPLKKIAISLGGPLFNVILALLIFFCIELFGYTTHSFSNQIILINDYISEPLYPSKIAGFQTGDKIIAINKKETKFFSDIYTMIASSPNKPLDFTVQRGDNQLTIIASPILNKETGAGQLGIYPWVDPVIARVEKSSAAGLAGLLPGDIIIAIDDTFIKNTQELYNFLSLKRPQKCTIKFIRNNEERTTTLIPLYTNGNIEELGIYWESIRIFNKANNIFEAFAKGYNQAIGTIIDTYKGIISLFRGTNILNAIAGPARITWTVGKVTADSIAVEGFSNGLLSALNLLALISIALFVMNLLPIPVLDGGWIVLFIIEIFTRKPVSLKTIVRYQQIGLLMLVLLFGLSLFSDFLFFLKQ